MEPRPERAEERRRYGPHPDDVDLFDGPDEDLDVDVEAHLRWLETGEGDPWPASQS